MVLTKSIELDVKTIERYNLPVPRYTSYPTVPYWKEGISPDQYKQILAKANIKDKPLSLYIHLPFCERRCSFCGCNTHITKRKDRLISYAESLKKEIRNIARILSNRRIYSQFHIGGGTPTYYPPEALDDLLTYVETLFKGTPDAERSIEIHPSVTSEEHIDTLIKHGFNRISMGVQDFDPLVQEKIHRYQTYEETEHIISYARKQGVTSINIDLIYGLPYQTKPGFSNTMTLIHQLKPDRLAVYSYAHLPSVFRHQAIFPEESIPKGKDKFELFLLARQALIEGGYKQIGFDHFALPQDELWHAYLNGDLQRNFMGYTTHAGTDLLAFGYSGISELGNAYVQNTKTLRKYQEDIEKHGVSPNKGLILAEDDMIRKFAIRKWLCQYRVSTQELREKFGEKASDLIKSIEIHFPSYEKEGLVVRKDGEWLATDLGRLFARIPASSMDAYVKKHASALFSKAI